MREKQKEKEEREVERATRDGFEWAGVEQRATQRKRDEREDAQAVHDTTVFD